MNEWMADEHGDVIFSMLAGWQTGMSTEIGVALRLAYYATPREFETDAPSSVQLLLQAERALELGEELIRQGRAALGNKARDH